MGSTWNQFSTSAKNTILFAQQCAWRHGVSEVGPEHVAHGLVEATPGISVTTTVAAQVLRALEIPPGRLLVPEPVGEVVLPDAATMQLNSSAKRLIDLAVLAKQRLGDTRIGTEHLLLGLVQVHSVVGLPQWDYESVRVVLMTLRQSNRSPWWQFPKRSLSEP